jgi:hypothetical protein
MLDGVDPDGVMQAVLVVSLAIASLVQGTVAVIRMAVAPPRWVVPLVAILAGVGAAELLILAPRSMHATALLGGWMAALAAVGTVELVGRAKPRGVSNTHGERS